MIISKRFYQGTIFLLLFGLAGCYPEKPDYASDLDLVATNYSPSFDFKSHHTYSIPDSIIKITGDIFNNPNGNGKPQFLGSDYSTVILNQIKQNMSAYGWTLVNKNNNPDAIILVSSMVNTNVYYYYDWDYWDWWYPGVSPDWGWYYPGYSYPVYATGYRTGSIFIQMTDNMVHVPNGDNVAVAWSSILNGLAEGGTPNINARLQTSINTAFNQSPYLKIN